ncbi:hypothetical protein BV20DRAFT_982964 [Pilatotrama ljubarskyi]|nr:hypothetical protein BV20DRAFT_982964 [Pilatotrama ljubarskyi]
MRTSTVLHCLYFLLVASVGASAALIERGESLACRNEVVASETFIGEARNVKLTHSRCADTIPASHRAPAVSRRQNDTQAGAYVCGASCQTYCWNPAGGGPDSNDCKIVADALLYDSQNVGNLFDIGAKGTPANTVTLQYGTCLTYFYNKLKTSNLTYCRTEWSNLVNWLTDDCGPSKNAHGGLCVSDQNWFIHSAGDILHDSDELFHFTTFNLSSYALRVVGSPLIRRVKVK